MQVLSTVLLLLLVCLLLGVIMFYSTVKERSFEEIMALG